MTDSYTHMENITGIIPSLDCMLNTLSSAEFPGASTLEGYPFLFSTPTYQTSLAHDA